MERVPQLVFGPFRLDTEKKRIWREDQEVVLRRTAVSVLQLLVENANVILTKEQVVRYVWPKKYPTAIALRVCIREIRQALGDDVNVPRYVETVGRNGYRYIGPMGEGVTRFVQGELSEGFEHIVGRKEELEQLD